MQQASSAGKHATCANCGKTPVTLVVLLIGLKLGMASLIGQATMNQISEQFLPFVLEELLKKTQITSPYDGLIYTHSELTIFRPNGCRAQGDSSIESEGASFLSRTKLNKDQVCTRSLRPVVMAADKFFLQISLILLPSSLEEKFKVKVYNNEK